MNSKALFFVALTVLLGNAPYAASRNANAQEWNFRVYLGDSAIGQHRFRLDHDDELSKLTTEADFKVKFLFITAYRYQHTNTETWHGNCLRQIESRTDANGRILQVRGQQESGGFRIEMPEPREPVAGCVKSFAYWDPDILDEEALLNPQTGELMPVAAELLGEETLEIRGSEVPARKYRLLTSDLALNIWYSTDSEWLALESTTKDGRTLRYELI